MLVISSIVESKMQKFYDGKAAGDKISQHFAIFDILNLVCAMEGKDLSKYEYINLVWKELHTGILKNVCVSTIENLAYLKNKRIDLYNEQQVEKFLKKDCLIGEFNKLFKIEMETNPDAKESEMLIANFILKLQPTLASYLNKQKKRKEKSDSPKGIEGDVGILADDLGEEL